MFYLRLLLVLVGLFVGVHWVEAGTLRIALGPTNENPELQSRAYLFGHYVNRKVQVDSSYAANLIIMNLSDTLPHGLYSVMIYTNLKDVNDKYQRVGFDLIYNGEDIDIDIEITETRSYGVVSARAGNNATYFEHFERSRLLGKRKEALKTALQQYPAGDEFYTTLKNHFEKMNRPEFETSQLKEISEKDSIARFYLNTQSAVEKMDLSFFDFSSSLLKNSPFIGVVSWKYLDAAEKEIESTIPLGQRLIRRLAVLLPKLKADDAVKELMVGEIVRYYENKGMNDVVLYINEEHVLPDVCENTELTNRLEEKNRLLKKLLIGQPAPAFEFNSVNKGKGLYDINADLTLLVFWESICPHCQDLTDELAVFYDKSKNSQFEIIAVALDTSKVEYETYLAEHHFTWLNEVDYKGWDSPVAQEYNVRSTPSMFLLDREKKILARPGSVGQLKAFLPDY